MDDGRIVEVTRPNGSFVQAGVGESELLHKEAV
jgi:hypothetical protein